MKAALAMLSAVSRRLVSGGIVGLLVVCALAGCSRKTSGIFRGPVFGLVSSTGGKCVNAGPTFFNTFKQAPTCFAIRVGSKGTCVKVDADDGPGTTKAGAHINSVTREPTKECAGLAGSSTSATAAPGPLAPLRPTALALGVNGDLYVADPQRNQLLERHADGSFSVLAGTGTQGFSGDGGPAVDAELSDPSGMAFGADGTLYFADQGNDRVRGISPSGTITTVAGNGHPSTTQGLVTNGTPAASASFDASDVTIGPGGLLYIATGEQILRLNADHTLSIVVGAADPSRGALYGVDGPATEAGADGVDGMAFDGSGDLWFFGFDTKSVFLVTPGGTLTEPPSAQAIYPRGNAGLVTAPDGTVVAMNELSVVRLTTGGAQTLTSFSVQNTDGIRGFSPNGIAVGPDGSIYVDTYFGNGFADRSAILKLTPSGQLSAVLWESTNEPVGVLTGSGINGTHFGDTEAGASATLDQVFGPPTASQTFKNPGNCGIEASTRWGEVTAFFSGGHFVGYRSLGADARYPAGGGLSFGGPGRDAQTQLGLRVGDTLGLAQNLYGSALTTSAAQGGSWTATTPDGLLRGYLSGVPGQKTPPQLLIESIGAGDVGCPAASP